MKKNFDVSDKVMELGVLCECARAVMEDMVTDYFALSKPEPKELLEKYDHFTWFSEIAFDYICRLNDGLNLLQKEVDSGARNAR